MKVNDIRPDRLASGHKAAIFRDVAMSLDWKPDFVRVPCPACNHDQAEYAFDKNGLDYDRCTACGSVYLNPRPTQAMLEEFFPASVNRALWAKEVFPATLEARRQSIIRAARGYAASCAQGLTC